MFFYLEIIDKKDFSTFLDLFTQLFCMIINHFFIKNLP